MREDGSGERHQLHLGQAGDPPDARKRVNYNDLTVLPLWKSWLVRGIIPKWPKISG